MNMKLVEPLRELFKDEVRALGPRTRPPEAFVGPPSLPGPGPRHPLPRRDHPEKLDTLRKADAVYLEEIRRAGLYDQIWQAFAVLLPVAPSG
jgi:GMP synthase (glutamine-hydrolysing)